MAVWDWVSLVLILCSLLSSVILWEEGQLPRKLSLSLMGCISGVTSLADSWLGPGPKEALQEVGGLNKKKAREFLPCSFLALEPCFWQKGLLYMTSSLAAVPHPFRWYWD